MHITIDRVRVFLSLAKRGLQQKNRIPSDNFPPLPFSAELYCFFIMITYSCMFCGAWNFYFPSRTERILWRVASLIAIFYVVPGSFIFACIEYTYFGHSKYSRRRSGWAEDRIDRVRKMLGFLGLIPPPLKGQAPDAEIGLRVRPWRVYLPWPALTFCQTITVLYCFARAFILVEDFIGLRRLPSSAYDTVEFSTYLPQV